MLAGTIYIILLLQVMHYTPLQQVYTGKSLPPALAIFTTKVSLVVNHGGKAPNLKYQHRTRDCKPERIYALSLRSFWSYIILPPEFSSDKI